MHAGSVGGDKGGDKKPPRRDKLQLSACDTPTNDFQNAWLTLKELHDKELHHLQAKLTSLRKQRLADGRWTGSTAKIKELTEQLKVLSATITELQDKLRSKTCEQCTVNETYRSTLQQEFYDIQQQNLKLIAELTAERNKLKEENKMLSAKLKLNQQQFHHFSDSDDVFIPCSQRTMPVFSIMEPEQGYPAYLPVKLTKQSNTEQMKSGGEKEQQESPKFPIPFHSQDLFDVPQTSFEKISPNSSKPTPGGISDTKASASFPLISAQSPQREHEFQVVSNLSEDKPGQPKRKQTITQKTSSQKSGSQKDFSWSLSSISTGKNPTIQVVSETSEENMPDYTSSFPFHTERKETLSSNVFPFDYTLSGKRRSSIGIPRYNTGLRDGNIQIPSNEQSTLRKTTNESTGAAGYGTDKPQGDPQSPVFGCRIKRKARMQSERRRK